MLALIFVLSISLLNRLGPQIRGIFMAITGSLSVAGHGFGSPCLSGY